jgi:hypothetical protein
LYRRVLNDRERILTLDEMAAQEFEAVIDFISTDKDPAKRQRHHVNETFLCEM